MPDVYKVFSRYFADAPASKSVSGVEERVFETFEEAQEYLLHQLE